MKILIADDNGVTRALLEKQAIRWGYDPVLVRNGTEAWSVLQQDDAPRLAILDWQMPGLDGIEVCKRIKQSPTHPFTYVVLLTGRDAEEDMVCGLEAGADDYLTKPVQPAILRGRLMAGQRIVEVVPPKEWTKPHVSGYEVKQLLGKGAYATVWSATHLESSKQVALKIIRVDLATDDVFGRFAREIHLMQQMDHPNIAHIFDSKINQEIGYYAMELIDGSSLDKYVRDHHPKAGRILTLVSQVADALQHAHEQGIIHRDLKPSNIMVNAKGVPKLVDFGLAKSLFQGDSQIDPAQTLDGSAVGTPLFMAPEQARGQNKSLDGRTDVYALGIVLYLLCVRRHPHNVNPKDCWETIQEIARGRARPPREVKPDFDPELEKIIMKALAHDPGARYQSAGAFADTLRAFVRKRCVVKPQTTPEQN